MSEADVRLAADAVEARRDGRHLLLLLDFDGTLCEFDPDPEAVRLPPERRALLETIAMEATIALVSGRRLADVQERCGLRVPAWYAGLHGFEIAGPGERFEHPGIAEATGTLRHLSGTLLQELTGLPGVFVEDKGRSLAVHFRAASPEDARRAEDILARVTRPHIESGALRTLAGACMIELLPNVEWHKGSAVDWIRQRVGGKRPGVWPLYIGDDVTD